MFHKNSKWPSQIGFNDNKSEKKITSAGENINFEKYIDMGSVVNGLKIRIYIKKLKNDRVRAKKPTFI